jgi:hypothetical protein
MYAALIRAAERWRGLRMSEFERRQLQAIRTELDRRSRPFIQQEADLTHAGANLRGIWLGIGGATARNTHSDNHGD